jgi:hypothetical protein
LPLGTASQAPRRLARFEQEDARLKAERSGGSAAKEPGREVLASVRYRDAVDHTRKIEDEFDRDLARMGWYQQPSPEVRREIEEKAFAGVRELHGESAAEHSARPYPRCHRAVHRAILGYLSHRVLSHHQALRTGRFLGRRAECTVASERPLWRSAWDSLLRRCEYG